MHIVVLIIISVLTASFLFATAFAFFPDPRHEDYCDGSRPYPVFPVKDAQTECEAINFAEEERVCYAQGGSPEYQYDEEGCPIGIECNMCYKQLEEARESYQANRFYILAVLSVMIIILSLYAVKDNTPLLFSITTGIIVGSLISIIIMSFMTLNAFSLYARPFIFLLQIILVILVAVKKFSNNNTKKK